MYIVSTLCRVRWMLRIHHKMQTMFFSFWGEPFQRRFASRHLHRGLLVLYFSLVSVFVPLYDLYVVSETKTYKLFAKFLMINSCVIEKYIVNVIYVVNDDRLGCFVFEKQIRKTTAECYSDTCEAVL